MNNKVLLAMVAGGVIVITTLSDAQDNESGSRDPNEIFNSIMQTMPDAMKARIDSASALRRSNANPVTNQSSNTVGAVPGGTVHARQAGIDQLPETIREQVRKTMQEIEEGNRERMVQFKETRNQNDK